MGTLTKRLEKIEAILKASKKREDYSYYGILSKEELEKLIEKRLKVLRKDPDYVKRMKEHKKMSRRESEIYIDKVLKRRKRSRLGKRR